MTGTKHGLPDLFNLVLKPYALALRGIRPVRTVQNDVLDMAFENGYRKGYSNGAEDAFGYATDALAGLGDTLADEQRDGYFRGRADAESEKGE